MLVLKTTSQCIWLFTALPSIDRVVGGINLKCWSFCTQKRKGHNTHTISSNSLYLLMAYLNNVEYIVFIGLFENASGDLTKKKPDLNVFLIQKQRRIHISFVNIHIHRISLIPNGWKGTSSGVWSNLFIDVEDSKKLPLSRVFFRDHECNKKMYRKYSSQSSY